MGNGSAGPAPCNGTALPPPPPPPPPAVGGHNIAALVLGIVLILLIVGGNGLVCLSVCTERALKTTTNYFIVSLAVADLLLALLVLPLYVYSEVRLPGGAAGVTGGTEGCGFCARGSSKRQGCGVRSARDQVLKPLCGFAPHLHPSGPGSLPSGQPLPSCPGTPPRCRDAPFKPPRQVRGLPRRSPGRLPSCKRTEWS